MKNLRIILLYKVIIVLFVITLGTTFYRVKIKSISVLSKDEISGIVKSVKVSSSYVDIELENSNILVRCYGDVDVNLGDDIRVKGKLEIPSKNTIPNLFNYQNYLFSKGIYYIMVSSDIVKVRDNFKFKYKVKNSIISYIYGFKTKDYLNTFILGNNSIDDDIKVSIKNNGISHLFAVSGMHLSLFSLVLLSLFRKLGIHDNASYIVIIVFFLFFAFLTNYSPSVLRSLLMFIGLSLNKIFDFKIKSFYICLLSLVILLLYNPFYVYNIGFVFSYVVSLSLIIFGRNYSSYFKNVFITSMISFLVSIPILFQNYYQINLLTPLINVIFVPLISFIIFPFSLLTFIIKPLDDVFLIFINVLEKLSLFFSQIHFNILLSKSNVLVVFIYYAFISICIREILSKKYLKTVPLVLLLFLHFNSSFLVRHDSVVMLDQTTPNMIQRIIGIFERKPLISKEI